jgi:MtrB/PioB family decaheme-associated outer membrane protein
MNATSRERTAGKGTGVATMNRYEIMLLLKRGSSSVLAAAILCIPLLADADEPPVVDTSHWVCKYCPFDAGLSANLELGPGYVSADSFKFGEYTGLDRKGGFVVGNADARYRERDGSWLDFSASDLGLDSRSVSIEGGKQGNYRLSLNYRELPHFISDTAVSPYLGTGTSSLTLPSGWIPAGTTGAMANLAASLHGVDLETKRERLDLAASLTPVVHWEFAVKYRHETKTGRLGTAGAFEFNSSQLVMPVDYDTNQIDASASYNGPRLHARFAYYGSLFTNNDQSLTWSNAYPPLVTGATAGELALSPSNRFHQLVVSGGYQFNTRTHATADIALGRMTQDEAFLPATLNSSLVTAPLPRNSLDGRVNTLSANLRLTSAVSAKLRLNGAYTYDDRDNRTPQSIYDWITTDTSAALPRTNLPYSSTHSLLKLNADYAVKRDFRFSLGYDYDAYRRTLQEIDRTRENSFWGKVSASVNEHLDFTLKRVHAERTVSAYHANPDILPPENPLIRKYDMADRSRDSVELRADDLLTDRITVGLAANFAWDDYRQSVIGLLDDRDNTVTVDASFVLSEKTSATLYANHEQIRSDQSNAVLLTPAPTWFAGNNDSIDTAGVGIKRRASEKLAIGADYTVSRSIGRISITGGTPRFPDLGSRLDSIKLYATYQLKRRLSVHLAYWYENYNSQDWMLDGVTPSTIANVISLGQGSPSYHIHVVTVSARYGL